jgi:hypothetical protein
MTAVPAASMSLQRSASSSMNSPLHYKSFIINIPRSPTQFIPVHRSHLSSNSSQKHLSQSACLPIIKAVPSSSSNARPHSCTSHRPSLQSSSRDRAPRHRSPNNPLRYLFRIPYPRSPDIDSLSMIITQAMQWKALPSYGTMSTLIATFVHFLGC